MTTLVVITNSWDELMCSGMISDSCCTSRIRPAKKHKHHLIWISHWTPTNVIHTNTCNIKKTIIPCNTNGVNVLFFVVFSAKIYKFSCSIICQTLFEIENKKLVLLSFWLDKLILNTSIQHLSIAHLFCVLCSMLLVYHELILVLRSLVCVL